MMNRIYLIGYMGAGKTTLGRMLSDAMELTFIDLDTYIENRYRKSISEIFAEKGEVEFRKIEQAMLHEVGLFEQVIIATGGGAPCFFDNMDFMNETGLTVYLKTDTNTLFERLRIAKASRPILKDKSDAELICFIAENLKRRESSYLNAKVIFDADFLDTRVQLKESMERLRAILLTYANQ